MLERFMFYLFLVIAPVLTALGLAGLIPVRYIVKAGAAAACDGVADTLGVGDCHED